MGSHPPTGDDPRTDLMFWKSVPCSEATGLNSDHEAACISSSGHLCVLVLVVWSQRTASSEVAPLLTPAGRDLYWVPGDDPHGLSSVVPAKFCYGSQPNPYPSRASQSSTRSSRQLGSASMVLEFRQKLIPAMVSSQQLRSQASLEPGTSLSRKVCVCS